MWNLQMNLFTKQKQNSWFWKQTYDYERGNIAERDKSGTRDEHIHWRSEVKSLRHVWLSMTPWPKPTRLPHPWDFPGKNTGVSCHFLFQGIFLTQGWHPHWQADCLPLSHQGSPWYKIKSIQKCAPYTNNRKSAFNKTADSCPCMAKTTTIL